MRSKARSFIGIAALAALIAGCTSWDNRTTRQTKQPLAVAVGEPAPEIDGDDIDGVPMKLSDYRGKVVMLDFWGNW